ncbi:hypothetical protein [Bifidobacterium sp. SO4]|uniref:hypothetical protein n=1 Tax=Bifidobacterium sp. SO4 TaxID=2809030 RepID=UPI001BDD09C7|nr:hypothetical protein [Bifidobacterium sp. SO4]MBT1170260.1 hypothetical protein [Bifidobacterium sp. SO4]
MASARIAATTQEGKPVKVCEVPLSVNPFSQGNIEPMIMIGVGAGGVMATLVLAFRFFRKPGMWRAHPQSTAWYAAIAAIQTFIATAVGMTMGSWHRGVSPHTLERVCGVSDLHVNGGMTFAWLEDPGYPYLGGESRYGPIWFTNGGKAVAGGITLQGDTATLYQGDYDSNITVNVHDAGETVFLHLFFMALIMFLMLFVAFTVVMARKPIEDEPTMAFVTWLCVFIIVLMTGISIPVVDARWIVPVTLALLIEDIAAFAGPFLLAGWLNSKRHRPRAESR